jgi:hypothetical protein
LLNVSCAWPGLASADAARRQRRRREDVRPVMKDARWWFVGLMVCAAPGCLLMQEGGVEDEPRLEQVPLEQGYTGCGDPDDPDDRYSVCHPNQSILPLVQDGLVQQRLPKQ